MSLAGDTSTVPRTSDGLVEIAERVRVEAGWLDYALRHELSSMPLDLLPARELVALAEALAAATQTVLEASEVLFLRGQR